MKYTDILAIRGDKELTYLDVVREYFSPLINGNDIVFKTSGSTGKPKEIRHSISKFMQRYSTPRAGYRTVITLDLTRLGGIDALLHTFFYNGLAIIPETKYASEVLELIEKNMAELLITSPTTLRLMLLENLNNYDLSSLKIIAYGSERMPDSLLYSVSQAFPNVKLKETYGLTEIGTLRTHSDWKLLKIVDRNYKVEDDILYIEDDGEWINTGDRVKQVGEYFEILGRNSSAINVGGFKIQAEEVEGVLEEICKDAIVYGEPNDLLGNIVVADVVLHDKNIVSFTKDSIFTYCGTRLDKYKIPMKINFVDSIERLESGKKKRK